MKNKASSEIFEIIHPSLPDYDHRGSLLFAIPIGAILSGILLDGSGFSKSTFYIQAFVQPLYIPAKHLVLTFGIRVPGIWEYKSSDITGVSTRLLEAIRVHCLPLHRKLGSVEAFIHNVEGVVSPSNIHLHQALIFSMIRLGRYGEAASHFPKLERLVKAADPKVGWPCEVLSETEQILDKAKQEPKAAAERLRLIECATLTALQLDHYAHVE